MALSGAKPSKERAEEILADEVGGHCTELAQAGFPGGAPSK